jgi:hypothetical protein
VKNAGKSSTLVAWGALAILSVALVTAGCKSAPPLSQADATSMIQANYSTAAPAAVTIVVNDLGMREGVTAKYWTGLKKYPNGYWADFKLTDDGKKLLKTSNGNDVIEWRPESPTDSKYAITLTTVATSRPKVSQVGDVEDMGSTKSVVFSEDVNLDPLPAPLQGIAQNPGNELSTPKHANFVLANGAWKLDSIQ